MGLSVFPIIVKMWILITDRNLWWFICNNGNQGKHSKGLIEKFLIYISVIWIKLNFLLYYCESNNNTNYQKPSRIKLIKVQIKVKRVVEKCFMYL